MDDELAPPRERVEEDKESTETKEQRLWDALYASAEGIVARPLPALAVVDDVLTIVAPGASMFERYGSLHRVRRQSEGGVDVIRLRAHRLNCAARRSRPSTTRRSRSLRTRLSGYATSPRASWRCG